MKWSIVFFFLLSVPVVSHAQQAVMNVIRHQWAGGVCCSGGMDYTCTIAFPAEHFVCFDSLQLQIDGIRVTIPDNRLTKTLRGDSLLLFSYTFGYGYFNGCSNELYQTNWYGLTTEDDGEQKKIQPDVFVLIRQDNYELGLISG